MPRRVYTLIYTLIFPLILFRLWWRGIKAPPYRKRWKERLGYFSKPDFAEPSLWIHTVSVGETIAAVPLIRAMQEAFPKLPLVVTTMTPTGSERVQALFGDSVFHVYAPYDLPGCFGRFCSRVNPMALVVMETELWPNWVALCEASGRPVFLANARLSERSARGYQRVSPVSRPMFGALSWVAAQNEVDGGRFASLGVSESCLGITGSIKFDIRVDDDIRKRGAKLRSEWGAKRPVIVAGSTHEGEETILISAFRALLQWQPNLLLVIVPRHPERFEAVARLLKDSGLKVLRRSETPTFSSESQVILGDTMGELMTFYAAGDIAFVGGSLIERGGHNPLEPAACGLPVLMGEHTFNFADICQRLTQTGALITVSAETLQENLKKLLEDNLLRQEMGGNGESFVRQNQGAVDRLMAGIRSRLPALELYR